MQFTLYRGVLATLFCALFIICSLPHIAASENNEPSLSELFQSFRSRIVHIGLLSTGEKQDALTIEEWHKKNSHFKKIIKLFISVPTCEYMFTYLKEHNAPRSGNAENSIKLLRSWEDPRYGFRTAKGLQDHLKLYQKMKYLGQI